ncbi:MAG: hypothetical protein J6N73_01820, partial [Prevotella sp.]|nr:hypothetical protein [Prevotella sp.]
VKGDYLQGKVRMGLKRQRVAIKIDNRRLNRSAGCPWTKFTLINLLCCKEDSSTGWRKSRQSGKLKSKYTQ